MPSRAGGGVGGRGAAAGALRRREAREAGLMLLPTVAAVLSVIALPLLANFWISAKPVTLGDLRAPAPIARESVKAAAGGGALVARYRVRNSSKKTALTEVVVSDVLPAGVVAQTGVPCEVLEAAEVDGGGAARIVCQWARLEAGGRTAVLLTLQAAAGATVNWQAAAAAARASKPQAQAQSDAVLFNTEFSWRNYQALFNAEDFWQVLWATLLYTFFGTGGALLLGLAAALLLAGPCRGRAAWRGLLLFPYVAPVIAVAFAWIALFDPFSGAVNALLVKSGAVAAPINFFGARTVPFDVLGFTFAFPLALASVIAFECWRYFPLAFLFILARMQSLNADLDDAADMDGASPLQKFVHILLPQLVGILSVMFLLRFIWTFNKFDDIFLLTGGAAGTRTMVVNVYEQAFALSNLGAGAAAAVAVFVVLMVFCVLYFRYAPKGEGW